MKRARDVVEILEAFDLTGSLREGGTPHRLFADDDHAEGNRHKARFHTADRTGGADAIGSADVRRESGGLGPRG